MPEPQSRRPIRVAVAAYRVYSEDYVEMQVLVQRVGKDPEPRIIHDYGDGHVTSMEEAHLFTSNLVDMPDHKIDALPYHVPK